MHPCNFGAFQLQDRLHGLKEPKTIQKFCYIIIDSCPSFYTITLIHRKNRVYLFCFTMKTAFMGPT